MGNRTVAVRSSLSGGDTDGPFRVAKTGDTLVDGDGNPLGGGGGRYLVFPDDTQFSETGTSYVTKKQFRWVLDNNAYPTSWRVVASIWADAGATASLLVKNGTSDDNLEVTTTNTSETLVSDTQVLTASADTLLTIEIQLKRTVGGTTAYVQYTAIYFIL